MTQKIQFGGDSPQQRFGHTFTLINKHKGILFGGAVGDTGRYVITGDTFLCQLGLRRWKKLENKGTNPSSRAAHATVFCQGSIYVYGGALGGGELSDDQLYQLDLKNGDQNAVWSTVAIEGVSPGRRYGHVMAYLKPLLVVFGGNTGTQPVNEVITIDLTSTTEKKWNKISIASQKPPARVYHSAGVCKSGSANGMMVVFGGRTTDQSALNDTWGLRKHRDGRLDWVKAPYRPNQTPPKGRYQHSVLFLGTLMLVIGGRNNSIGQVLPTEVYETQTSEWFKLLPIERFRHACWISDTFLYIHAGFQQQSPNIPTDSIIKINLMKTLHQYPSLFASLTQQFGVETFESTTPQTVSPIIQAKQTSGNAAQKSQMGREVSHDDYDSNFMAKKLIQPANSKSIKLCQEVFCVNFDDNDNERVQKLTINQLQEENRKLKEPISMSNNNKYILEKIYSPILSLLFLKQTPSSLHSIIDLIIPLCDEIEKLVAAEPTLLRLRAPLKVFGDIHGQVTDLNKFFQMYGAPTDDTSVKGDIEATDYLFLGDYVDRGNRSVETLLLLFALKLKYPENIHLLRGSHEDRRINKSMGFGDECHAKLRQQNLESAGSFFQRANKIFDLLPLAAIVQDRIFCVHGGIGNTLKYISDIDNIQKPIQINHNPKSQSQRIVYDLLWSDPSDQGQNAVNTTHDYFKTKQNFKFGAVRVNKFCQENKITQIIRSGQPYMTGISVTHQNIITVFSCTDYCNQKNSAAIVIIKKSLDINHQTIPFTYNQGSKWEQAKPLGNLSSEQQGLRSANHTPPKK